MKVNTLHSYFRKQSDCVLDELISDPDLLETFLPTTGTEVVIVRDDDLNSVTRQVGSEENNDAEEEKREEREEGTDNNGGRPKKRVKYDPTLKIRAVQCAVSSGSNVSAAKQFGVTPGMITR